MGRRLSMRGLAVPVAALGLLGLAWWGAKGAAHSRGAALSESADERGRHRSPGVELSGTPREHAGPTAPRGGREAEHGPLRPIGPSHCEIRSSLGLTLHRVSATDAAGARIAVELGERCSVRLHGGLAFPVEIQSPGHRAAWVRAADQQLVALEPLDSLRVAMVGFDRSDLRIVEVAPEGAREAALALDRSGVHGFLRDDEWAVAVDAAGLARSTGLKSLSMHFVLSDGARVQVEQQLLDWRTDEVAVHYAPRAEPLAPLLLALPDALGDEPRACDLLVAAAAEEGAPILRREVGSCTIAIHPPRPLWRGTIALSSTPATVESFALGREYWARARIGDTGSVAAATFRHTGAAVELRLFEPITFHGAIVTPGERLPSLAFASVAFRNPAPESLRSWRGAEDLAVAVDPSGSFQFCIAPSFPARVELGPLPEAAEVSLTTPGYLRARASVDVGPSMRVELGRFLLVPKEPDLVVIGLREVEAELLVDSPVRFSGQVLGEYAMIAAVTRGAAGEARIHLEAEENELRSGADPPPEHLLLTPRIPPRGRPVLAQWQQGRTYRVRELAAHSLTLSLPPASESWERAQIGWSWRGLSEGIRVFPLGPSAAELSVELLAPEGAALWWRKGGPAAEESSGWSPVEHGGPIGDVLRVP